MLHYYKLQNISSQRKGNCIFRDNFAIMKFLVKEMRARFHYKPSIKQFIIKVCISYMIF